MSRNPIVTFAQDRLDAARREIKAAVIDFDVSDEKLLEMCIRDRCSIPGARDIPPTIRRMSVHAETACPRGRSQC